MLFIMVIITITLLSVLFTQTTLDFYYITNLVQCENFLVFLQKMDIVMLFLHLALILILSKVNKKSVIGLLLTNLGLLFFLEIYILLTLCNKGLFYYQVSSSTVVESGLYLSFYNWYINPVSFIFDKITIVFSSTTILIGFFSSLYSVLYLASDKGRDKFLVFLNLFILSMVFFVKTNSIIVLVLCWEFLGISSFFLIGHYHLKPMSLKSAIKAFSFNRLSDLFIFFFIVSYIYIFGTFSMSPVTNNSSSTYHNITFLFLFLAASVKSAQGLFFFWLPDSMEAPIPASALIHSATLVSAGIYLCLRYSHIIDKLYLLRVFIVTSGILSAVIFSFISAMQTDIKRLLAYSTIANCGFMYFLVGLGSTELTLLYFILHGLLKSFLFMFFGYLIILNNHNQDTQFWEIPKTYWFLTYIANVSLLSLGAVNLTIIYDIKHLLFTTCLFGSKTSSLILILLFYVYSINSMLYGFNYFFRTESNTLVFKKNRSNDLANYKFICLFIFIIIIYSLLVSILLKTNYIYTTVSGISFLDTYKLFIIIVPFALASNSYVQKILPYFILYPFITH